MTEINRDLLRKDAPIGVFDSGVGGLTVAREIMRQIPNEKIIYFGDTARVPYGSKSQDTVTRFSEQIVRFLRTFQVKTIVVACNTASAYALDTLEADTDIPIIGVIKPGANVAADVTRNGRIGVIATEATIGSRMYPKYIEELDKLDQGFETVYDRVREELLRDKARYRMEIIRMKELIQQITDKIVTLNAGNMRNKMLAENQFNRKRVAIGTGASQNKAARNYYNNMNRLNYVSPQFYDNKK